MRAPLSACVRKVRIMYICVLALCMHLSRVSCEFMMGSTFYCQSCGAPPFGARSLIAAQRNATLRRCPVYNFTVLYGPGTVYKAKRVAQTYTYTEMHTLRKPSIQSTSCIMSSMSTSAFFAPPPKQNKSAIYIYTSIEHVRHTHLQRVGELKTICRFSGCSRVLCVMCALSRTLQNELNELTQCKPFAQIRYRIRNHNRGVRTLWILWAACTAFRSIKQYT